LIIAFEQFAAALGSAYDGDTRIAVVQIGREGFLSFFPFFLF